MKYAKAIQVRVRAEELLKLGEPTLAYQGFAVGNFHGPEFSIRFYSYELNTMQGMLRQLVPIFMGDEYFSLRIIKPKHRLWALEIALAKEQEVLPLVFIAKSGDVKKTLGIDGFERISLSGRTPQTQWYVHHELDIATSLKRFLGFRHDMGGITVLRSDRKELGNYNVLVDWPK